VSEFSCELEFIKTLVSSPGKLVLSIRRRYISLFMFRWDNSKVTWYDEDYNGRERTGKNKLPPLRQWNGHHLGWKPEKSDHPIQGKPTLTGMGEKKREQWKKQIETWNECYYSTNYGDQYITPSHSFFPERYGMTPKALSSQLNKHNVVNKNVTLRGQKYRAAPEFPPMIPKPSVEYPIVPPFPR